MKPLRVVVVGTLASNPFAGMAWMHMQIAAGLARIGHEVWYMETTSAWPFDPNRNAVVQDARYALPYLADVARSFGLEDRWAYRRSFADGAWFGPSAEQAETILRDADVVLNVSGATALRSEGLDVGRLAYLGTDPGSDEISVANADAHGSWILDEHDLFATYAENIGSPLCALPPMPVSTVATRQPIVLDFWSGRRTPNGKFTTVGNWRQEGRDFDWQGEHYTWSKHHEFLRFVSAPKKAGIEFEFCTPIGKLNEVERSQLEQAGWRLIDAGPLTSSPERYRDYLQESAAEFTVAKDQNVRLRTGWFSERSACYLAAGRPVVTQDTGFGNNLPTGLGLVAFSTMEEAVDAMKEVSGNYEAHSRAASEIAHGFFRAEQVLADLLTAWGLS